HQKNQAEPRFFDERKSNDLTHACEMVCDRRPHDIRFDQKECDSRREYPHHDFRKKGKPRITLIHETCNEGARTFRCLPKKAKASVPRGKLACATTDAKRFVQECTVRT